MFWVRDKKTDCVIYCGDSKLRAVETVIRQDGHQLEYKEVDSELPGLISVCLKLTNIEGTFCIAWGYGRTKESAIEDLIGDMFFRIISPKLNEQWNCEIGNVEGYTLLQKQMVQAEFEDFKSGAVK